MKHSIEFHADRITLTLPTLKDFDALYPAAEEVAIARNINLVDVFRGNEFMTQINIERYQKARFAYYACKLRHELKNSQN